MADTQLQAPTGVTQSHSLYVNALYNQYGAMLLGYIFEAVNNMVIAEQHLIAVFKAVPNEWNELSKSGTNVFCHLQSMARKSITGHSTPAATEVFANRGNKYIAMMSHEQQQVFCAAYWHGKTVAALANELNKSEDTVKRILKECFTTIRNNS